MFVDIAQMIEAQIHAEVPCPICNGAGILKGAIVEPACLTASGIVGPSEPIELACDLCEGRGCRTLLIN